MTGAFYSVFDATPTYTYRYKLYEGGGGGVTIVVTVCAAFVPCSLWGVYICD